MDFGKLASLSVGLAGFLGGLWLVLQIIKTLRRNGGQRILTSGEQSSDYWKNAIRDVVKGAMQEELRARGEPLKAEDVRAIIREELGRK